MADVQVAGSAKVGSADLDQEHRLKPTAVFGLFEAVLPDTWAALAGTTRDDYFATHPARLVFSYLRVERLPARLRLDEQVSLHFTGLAGHYPGRDGAPRYGLRDHLVISGQDGEALRWDACVYWVRMDGGGAGGFLDTPAPALRADQSQALTVPPRRPPVEGDVVGRFRWTPRETDFNRHVYFGSYLERAENALADLGRDPSLPTTWELWFSRPAFLGETMEALVEESDGTAVIALRRDDGTVCATIQAT